MLCIYFVRFTVNGVCVYVYVCVCVYVYVCVCVCVCVFKIARTSVLKFKKNINHKSSCLCFKLQENLY